MTNRNDVIAAIVISLTVVLGLVAYGIWRLEGQVKRNVRGGKEYFLPIYCDLSVQFVNMRPICLNPQTQRAYPILLLTMTFLAAGMRLPGRRASGNHSPAHVDMFLLRLQFYNQVLLYRRLLLPWAGLVFGLRGLHPRGQDGPVIWAEGPAES
jgi:hypothetical protein